jgi:hypothetical protein
MYELPPRFPHSVMLGFDFVGAGNIGDDLMVAGFLDAIAALRPRFWPRLYGACAHNVLSQRKRFGQILWNPRARPDVDCWAGVGGTPFQTTCGDWMLDFFQRELPRTRNIPRRVLVAIGVEGEIESRRGEYSAVAQEFQHISTRDEFSRAILVERLGVPEARVMAGADLANLSLARLFADTTPPKKEYRLGLTLAGDTLSPQDFCEIEKFLASRTHPSSPARRGWRRILSVESIQGWRHDCRRAGWTFGFASIAMMT